MSASDDSAIENAPTGRQSILSRIPPVLARFRASFSEQQVGKSKGGHLGQRRAIRLSALLAPRNRRRVGAGAGVLIILGALAASFVLRSPESLPLSNAIWLDRAWTFGDLDDSQIRDFTDRLAEHQIGTAYAYASSLSIDNRWSGDPQGDLSFMESRSKVADFVTAFKSKHSSMRVFAWIEIWTHLDNADGYRLDDSSLHSNIADFCRLLVTQLGFDGLLLDVKPLFSDNSDLIRLIQQVRAAVGVDVPLAVAVTADLTPPDGRLKALESIAPGTMWSSSFKRRLLVSVDEVVLLMYQSYRQEPRDYINWVAYHVEAYIAESDASTNVLVSVPNYGGASSAHNPAIETMANALEGVREGLRRLDEEQRAQLTGIAIYSDDQLSQSEWKTFRDMWLQP